MANRTRRGQIISGAPERSSRDPFRDAVHAIASATGICRTGVESYLKRGDTKKLDTGEDAAIARLAAARGMERRGKGFVCAAK